jgi:hypothetical protein
MGILEVVMGGQQEPRILRLPLVGSGQCKSRTMVTSEHAVKWMFKSPDGGIVLGSLSTKREAPR